jgi:hypothetical protein
MYSTLSLQINEPLLGLAISDQKIIPRKTELTEQLVHSGGIPAVPQNRKLSEFHSEPLRRGEKYLEFVEQKSFH